MIQLSHAACALLAAEAATEAAAELLRFRREGAAIGDCPFGDPDPVQRLAVALLQTARVEADLYPREALLNDPAPSAEYISAIGQLAAACAKFLLGPRRTVIPAPRKVNP